MSIFSNAFSGQKNKLFCSDPNRVQIKVLEKRKRSREILALAIIKYTWVWRHERESYLWEGEQIFIWRYTLPVREALIEN